VEELLAFMSEKEGGNFKIHQLVLPYFADTELEERVPVTVIIP
jgi:hypothetical protein